MNKYRKKPITIEAVRWFKNGDHPEDNVWRAFEDSGARPAEPREGAIVRYYRHPEVPGETLCVHCGNTMHDHGWIDTLEGGHNVCPGDWVITGIKGERYPCKHEIFMASYEDAERVSSGVDLIAAERRRQLDEECWTTEHDDAEHKGGQLAGAAACYALWNCPFLHSGILWRFVMALWRWNHEWWKPKDPIRDLTRAGALIAAELDRLQRAQTEAPRIILPGE